MISFIVIGFNIQLFINHLTELDWPIYAVMFSAVYFVFVVYLIWTPIQVPEGKEEEEDVL